MAMSKSRQVDIAPDHFLTHYGLTNFGSPAMSFHSQPALPPLPDLMAARPQEPPRELRAMVTPPSPRVAIKVKGRILFISLADVVTVQAQGNYVSLQRNGGSHLMRESISAVAERFEPFGFIRIHRSVLVNSSFVEEIRSYPTGEYGLWVRGGKEYTVTRTYKKNLKSLAEFWIGTGAFLG